MSRPAKYFYLCSAVSLSALSLFKQHLITHGRVIKLTFRSADNIKTCLQETSGRVLTGYVWLRIGTGGGVL